jgi:cell division protein FtsL
MAKKRSPLSRVRVVYHRSKPLTKMAVAVVIILSIAALISLGAAQRSATARLEDLRSEAVALEEEQRHLQENISILGTPESVERIAIEELDMVKPGTVFFEPGK